MQIIISILLGVPLGVVIGAAAVLLYLRPWVMGRMGKRKEQSPYPTDSGGWTYARSGYANASDETSGAPPDATAVREQAERAKAMGNLMGYEPKVGIKP